MSLTGSYSLKWHGHGMHLNSSISGLYHSDTFTDVVLATIDGRFVSAHQFVLSACSSYLSKMFMVTNSSSTTVKTVVVLPSEISHATLNILLQYIYRGEAIVNHEQLPSIMKAAELLQIKGLCAGKDKSDSRSNTNSVLKQQNKNSHELKNNSEVIKVNHRVLIPEVRYSSESTTGSNNVERVTNFMNKTPQNTTNTSSTIASPKHLSPVRKRQKSNQEGSSEYDKDNNESTNEESMIEKMLIGEEVSVKEEPVEWEEHKSSDENGSVVKQEILSDEELEIEESKCYVPLTCDLCHETFTTPALWVRHIEQNHPTTALASGKRASMDDGNGEYPPLHCELCRQVFSVPADWVRHIQTHTEQQLATTHEPLDSVTRDRQRVECTVCGKMLQSQASMQIHSRTHTGERPYLCKLCGREFNVKSNYLRHLRTLHDQLVTSVSMD